MPATSAILNIRIGSEAKRDWYDLCNISAMFHACVLPHSEQLFHKSTGLSMISFQIMNHPSFGSILPSGFLSFS